MTLVLSVILLLIKLGSMLKVLGSISTMTGFRPSKRITSMVEANEKLGFGPDLREYGIGAQILKSCGVRKMRLLTNNPRKIVGLEGYHLEVVGREPIEIPANKKNSKYLKTKRDKLGHFILGEEEAVE